METDNGMTRRSALKLMIADSYSYGRGSAVTGSYELTITALPLFFILYIFPEAS